MIDTIQRDLFEQTWEQRFEDWVHTPQGRQVANRFIRIAWGLHNRKQQIGAKAIWERLRWHYCIARNSADEYRLNNNFTAYMARFAMDREPRLKGYFNTRQCGDRHPRRAILVTVKPKPKQEFSCPS